MQSKFLANPAVIVVLNVAAISVLGAQQTPKPSITEPQTAPTATQKATPPKNAPEPIKIDKPKDPTFDAFLDRVKDYLALQKKLEATPQLPTLKPTDKPVKVEIHETGLAMRLREARAAAKPGDIFGDAGARIRQLIAEDSENRKARDAYAAMEEVPAQNAPAVNASYPEKAPLATVPPLVLLKLPPLPEGLEYRFMGRDLILRDMKANLIVDFIHEAVPIIRK